MTDSFIKERTKAAALKCLAETALDSIRRFLSKNPFRREIAVVLVIKILALFLLWGLFFSHPDSSRLKSQNLMNHFISSAQTSV